MFVPIIAWVFYKYFPVPKFVDSVGNTLGNAALMLVPIPIVAWGFFKFFRGSKFVDSVGKAVLITGCDSGFGHQLALRARSFGFVVLAGCLKVRHAADDGNEGASILARNGCHVIKLDVTKQKDIDDAILSVDRILAENGCTLWAVVNNAGIAMHCELEWCSAEDFRRILDVNSVAPFCVAKAFLPALRRSQSGGSRVVNVASAAAYFTFPGLTGYAMSKHACRSLSDGMRREWKKFGIHVSCIEPTLYKSAWKPRTNITSSDYLIAKLKANWSELSDETKACYGSEYLANYEKMIANHYQNNGRSQIWEVIDALMEAIAISVPARHYQPGTGPKIRLSLLRCLPEFVIDKLLSGPGHMPMIE